MKHADMPVDAGLRHSAASFTYENVPVAIVIEEIVQIHDDYIE
jgi:transcription termination factor NusB